MTSRPHLGARSIGLRLALSFAGIVALMLAGDAVAFWQFREARAQAERLRVVELKALAVLRVHTDVLSFSGKLDSVTATRDARRFRDEAASLVRILTADLERAVRALSAAPADVARHAEMLRALETIANTLPPQIEAMAELAAAGDWEALRLRLENQARTYSAVTSELIEEVDLAVAAEEADTLRNLERMQQQAVLMLALSGLATLALAAVLGLAVTRSITRRLVRLDAAAQALARGEFQHQVEVAGTDELARLGAVFNDMARRLRELYEDVQSREEKYRGIVENAVEGIFQSTADGRLLTANPALARILGYDSPEELLSRVTDIEHQLYVDPADRRALLGRLARDGVVRGFECELKRKDGRSVWVSVNARALKDGTGKVLSIEGTNEDISDRRRAQELQDSLRRSETMSAMGSLLAGVAHEVRNPLFGISANLDAFEARFGQREEYVETIGRLRSEVDRLVALMSDLLEFGRPLEEQILPGAMAEVIEEAIAACQPLARQSAVSLASAVSADLAPVRMDRKRMVQAFENLLRNAVQHSPPGGTVVVDATPEDTDGERWVRCTVDDAGRGFRSEDLSAVFRPFFTRRRGGTGLGLAIVQRIVESHGGKVAAGNRPQGGARVVVRLPAA